MSEISGTHIYIEEAGSTLTCSSQSVWSVNGHAMITPCDGIISPPGFRYMSRALTKLSSMRSCTSRKPMGSDTIVDCTVSGAYFRFRMDGQACVKPGDLVSIGFNPKQAFPFDPASELHL